MILPQSIAVDGSVYEKIPFLQAALHDALVELLGSDSRKITVACVKDGSALGAAIAACISE
jgi:hexokinase